MWNLTTLETASQQRVAVLVAGIGEVLTGHAGTRGPGLFASEHPQSPISLPTSVAPWRATSAFVLIMVRNSAPSTKTKD